MIFSTQRETIDWLPAAAGVDAGGASRVISWMITWGACLGRDPPLGAKISSASIKCTQVLIASESNRQAPALSSCRLAIYEIL